MASVNNSKKRLVVVTRAQKAALDKARQAARQKNAEVLANADYYTLNSSQAYVDATRKRHSKVVDHLFDVAVVCDDMCKLDAKLHETSMIGIHAVMAVRSHDLLMARGPSACPACKSSDVSPVDAWAMPRCDSGHYWVQSLRTAPVFTRAEAFACGLVFSDSVAQTDWIPKRQQHNYGLYMSKAEIASIVATAAAEVNSAAKELVSRLQEAVEESAKMHDEAIAMVDALEPPAPKFVVRLPPAAAAAAKAEVK